MALCDCNLQALGVACVKSARNAWEAPTTGEGGDRRRGQRQGQALLARAGEGGQVPLQLRPVPVAGGQLARHALPPHGPRPARRRRPAGQLPVSALQVPYCNSSMEIRLPA